MFSIILAACGPAAIEGDYNDEVVVTNYVTEVAMPAGNTVEHTLYYSANPAGCSQTDRGFECQSFGGPVIVQRYGSFWVEGNSPLYPCTNCTVRPNRKESHTWDEENGLLSAANLRKFLELQALAEAEAEDQ